MSVSIYREDGSLTPVANGWMRTWVCTKAWWEANKATVPDGTLVYITDDVREKELEILDAVYPVGTIYQNGSDTRNPAVIFGSETEPFGTWRAIEGKFLLGMSYNAETDSYDIGGTGGSFSKTLAVANLPVHSHYFAPSGTVSVVTNPTFTGTRKTTTGMSGYDYAWFESLGGWGDHSPFEYGGRAEIHNDNFLTPSRRIGIKGGEGQNIYRFEISLSHTHDFTPEGTISGGSYSFSGTRAVSENTGSGTAFDITPPYVKVAIWQRTA